MYVLSSIDHLDISARCAEQITACQSLGRLRGHLASGVRMMIVAQGTLDLKPDFHLAFVSNHHQILLKAVQTREPLHSWPGKGFP